ncbi:phosphopantetheine-binding protein [Herbidospora daliensis]|uniref:phosphopantetheine-binding protein n=1 Tax=Herbidospora daliensis TaxID=295585 RepID=UPI000784FB96|nr:phosphopantetheine-binding protein [Herbidospora daliensis]
MTESEVAGLMAEILETDDLAADESFFEVGGTSFLVLTLIARIQERTGVTLRMIDVIRRPTPAGVHELVDGRA